MSTRKSHFPKSCRLMGQKHWLNVATESLSPHLWSWSYEQATPANHSKHFRPIGIKEEEEAQTHPLQGEGAHSVLGQRLLLQQRDFDVAVHLAVIGPVLTAFHLLGQKQAAQAGTKSHSRSCRGDKQNKTTKANSCKFTLQHCDLFISLLPLKEEQHSLCFVMR